MPNFNKHFSLLQIYWRCCQIIEPLTVGIYAAIVFVTFCFMELVAWFLHKYVMHGFGWFLHEDHHRSSKGRFEKNDIFGLFFSIFPIFIIASVYALMGKKLDFRVTPKVGTRTISFIQVCPQIIIFLLLIISIIVGILKVLTGQITTPYFQVICWAIYSATMLFIFIFYFYLEDIKKCREYEIQKT